MLPERGRASGGKGYTLLLVAKYDYQKKQPISLPTLLGQTCRSDMHAKQVSI